MLTIKKLILHVFYVNDILVTLLYLITTYHFREKCLYMYWYLYKLSYSINIYYYMQGRFLWMIVYQQVICSTSVWIIDFVSVKKWGSFYGIGLQKRGVNCIILLSSKGIRRHTVHVRTTISFTPPRGKCVCGCV